MYKKRGCGGSVQTSGTVVTPHHFVNGGRIKASLMKTNIRRRICNASASQLRIWILERIRSQKRKLHRKGSGERRARPFNQCINHTTTQGSRSRKTPRDHTDGGGLKPTAINPDYWDLVPHSDSTQQHETRDGISAIRRHKQPSGCALRRASAAG